MKTERNSVKKIKEQEQKKQQKRDAFKKLTPKLKPLKVDRRNI
jgi:hypothetical protein